ncbi:MAG: hypothetical protein JJ992_15925 [Planctomycetes bacterium]|nr:hypothetical protein [Planctomycetota bacterium]
MKQKPATITAWIDYPSCPDRSYRPDKNGLDNVVDDRAPDHPEFAVPS